MLESRKERDDGLSLYSENEVGHRTGNGHTIRKLELVMGIAFRHHIAGNGHTIRTHRVGNGDCIRRHRAGNGHTGSHRAGKGTPRRSQSW